MGFWTDLADSQLGKVVSYVPDKLRAKMPKSGPLMEAPEDYLGRNVGRQQVLADLEELEGLRKTGGPAYQEARGLQRSAARGQRALHRGLDRGGLGGRMGTQAAAKSYVASEGPVAITAELAKQGYTREIATASGLLAMDDSSFWQAILKGQGQKRRTDDVAREDRIAGGVGTAGTIIAGLATKGAAAAKTGGVVPGVGSEDTFPARLAPGEIVIPKELSAQLMEVMSRSVGGGDVVRAQTGGVVRRDPQTGYLVEDQNAMALQTMAVLKEQNERIKALEAGKKGKKKKGPMTGAEMKAEIDRMAAQPVLKEFETGFPRGTQMHDRQIRNWERAREEYGGLMPAPPPLRAQEYGPWEKGRPRGVWGEHINYGDYPPHYFKGSTQMPGMAPWRISRPWSGPGSDWYDERTPAKVDPRDVHRALMGPKKKKSGKGRK